MNEIFRLAPDSLITDPREVWNLYYFIREALEYMAMVNYPYESFFLAPMPGYPATVSIS